MKKIMALILIAAMIFSMTACSSGSLRDAIKNDTEEKTAADEDKRDFTLKLSHYRADGSIADIDAKAFADTVEAMDSSLDVEVYPAAQLGDYTTVQELVSVGDVEMQLATLSSTVDKVLGITSAPYICSTWDEAKKIFSRESSFTQMISDHLAQQSIKLLAVYPLYFGGVITKDPIDDPASMSKNGVKIRCQQMKGAELVSNMLGYMPTPMALSDCFTALQTGVIDGMIGSGAEGYYTGYRDVAEYYLPYNDHFEVWYLYISMDVWNQMTADQQANLQAAADKLESDRWEVAPTQTEEFEQELREAGVEVIEFTDEELNSFYERCQKEVWPELVEVYGQEAVDLVSSSKGE